MSILVNTHNEQEEKALLDFLESRKYDYMPGFNQVIDEALANNTKKQIKETIQKIDPNAITILFGSRATGTAKKDSDWDVLILLDTPSVSQEDERTFRNDLFDLGLEIGESISTFAYSLHDWNTRMSVSPLYQEVQKHGITL